ncbi:MAG TPA: acyl-CoA dehydrogenase family protein [Polyangia bacterium]|nr:acyl-CoA dehydrogenase family protein [Polyangia bacterium]
MNPFWQERHQRLREQTEAVARAIEHEHDPPKIVRILGQELGQHLERGEVTSLCVIREALAERTALGDTLFAMQGLGSQPIRLAGSEELKQRYVMPAALGRKLAAFALTEPEAGSDVASLRTLARRDTSGGHGGGGDSYVLDGEKTFISNAGLADFYVVFAKTDASAGGKGISAFVVDRDAPGLTFEPQTLIADHPMGALTFERCRAAARLGAEGDGLKIALGTLDRFRPTVGAAACGMARRALAETLVRVRTRVQFGKSLAEFQGTQFALADMATELDAARLLVYRAAAACDRGERATLEAAMAKLYATEIAQRVVDQALQLHGGAGLLAGTPTERLYRDVRALRIYEGTSEIQRIVIARELLRSGT